MPLPKYPLCEVLIGQKMKTRIFSLRCFLALFDLLSSTWHREGVWHKLLQDVLEDVDLVTAFSRPGVSLDRYWNIR